MWPAAEETPIRVCVTGGGEGIGLAIARAFYHAGAQVHIGEAEPEALARTLSEHPGMHGSVVDIGDAVEVETLFTEALDWLEGLDVLVNAAVVEGPRASLLDLDYEQWDRTVRINLSGMFYAVKQAAKPMRRQRCGSIVNLASTAARTGLPLRSAYVASMSGVLGFTYNVARELGPDNIRCNAVLPGFVDNLEGRRWVEALARERRRPLEETEAEVLGRVSMRSWIQPGEVAETVLFLASPAARHISGQAIGVCGNVEWEG